jgi:hypothetical protein
VSIHWTEFPERVELFGDLFSILETFEKDCATNVITSYSTAKESVQSAYTVEFMGLNRVEFVGERVPGWEALVTYAEREFYSVPDLHILRVIRGQVSEARDVSPAAVNAMTIVRVMDALAERRVEDVQAAEAPADPLAAFRWLKVTQIARLFALNAGQVSKLGDNGTFITNGKTSYERRIDVLSVVRRELARLERLADTDES